GPRAVATPVLGRRGPRDRLRRRGLGLVDRVGARGRLPGRPGARHAPGAVRRGGAGLGAGPGGHRGLAPRPGWGLGSPPLGREGAGATPVPRPDLVGLVRTLAR